MRCFFYDRWWAVILWWIFFILCFLQQPRLRWMENLLVCRASGRIIVPSSLFCLLALILWNLTDSQLSSSEHSLLSVWSANHIGCSSTHLKGWITQQEAKSKNKSLGLRIVNIYMLNLKMETVYSALTMLQYKCYRVQSYYQFQCYVRQSAKPTRDKSNWELLHVKTVKLRPCVGIRSSLSYGPYRPWTYTKDLENTTCHKNKPQCILLCEKLLMCFLPHIPQTDLLPGCQRELLPHFQELGHNRRRSLALKSFSIYLIIS